MVGWGLPHSKKTGISGFSSEILAANERFDQQLPWAELRTAFPNSLASPSMPDPQGCGSHCHPTHGPSWTILLQSNTQNVTDWWLHCVPSTRALGEVTGTSGTSGTPCFWVLLSQWSIIATHAGKNKALGTLFPSYFGSRKNDLTHGKPENANSTRLPNRTTSFPSLWRSGQQRLRRFSFGRILCNRKRRWTTRFLLLFDEFLILYLKNQTIFLEDFAAPQTVLPLR